MCSEYSWLVFLGFSVSCFFFFVVFFCISQFNFFSPRLSFVTCFLVFSDFGVCTGHQLIKLTFLPVSVRAVGFLF